MDEVFLFIFVAILARSASSSIEWHRGLLYDLLTCVCVRSRSAHMAHFRSSECGGCTWLYRYFLIMYYSSRLNELHPRRFGWRSTWDPPPASPFPSFQTQDESSFSSRPDVVGGQGVSVWIVHRLSCVNKALGFLPHSQDSSPPPFAAFF